MKNLTMGQLIEEARNLGCNLIPGDRIKFISYGPTGNFAETVYFDWNDVNCELKIRSTLKEVKDRIMSDFNDMAGSLSKLGLSLKYELGKVIIFKEYSQSEIQVVKEYSCNTTDLRKMVAWLTDTLLEAYDDTQASPAKILPKYPKVDFSKYPLWGQQEAHPQETYLPTQDDITPEEVLMPSLVIIGVNSLREFDYKAAGEIFMRLAKEYAEKTERWRKINL